MIIYEPKIFDTPKVARDKRSAWEGIDLILKDIIVRFGIKTNKCCEIGVEYGFSTSALACYFDKVIGVDTFVGDVNSGVRPDYFEETKGYLKDYPNIELIQSDYKDFINGNDERYDLIHIDMIHTYVDTFDCGEWAIKHSDVVLFHDTSIDEVRKACTDLQEKYDLQFYIYPHCYGLGILSSKIIE